mmetsp:Transcript_13098/g.30718  ORF Transcript_13098/g.30718 Transcript_13098/m.30718 type:complete len:222 (+) Transcript_13098:1303-1968(+)
MSVVARRQANLITLGQGCARTSTTARVSILARTACALISALGSTRPATNAIAMRDTMWCRPPRARSALRIVAATTPVVLGVCALISPKSPGSAVLTDVTAWRPTILSQQQRMRPLVSANAAQTCLPKLPTSSATGGMPGCPSPHGTIVSLAPSFCLTTCKHRTVCTTPAKTATQETAVRTRRTSVCFVRTQGSSPASPVTQTASVSSVRAWLNCEGSLVSV